MRVAQPLRNWRPRGLFLQSRRWKLPVGKLHENSVGARGMNRAKFGIVIVFISILLLPTCIALAQVDDNEWDDDFAGAREPVQLYLRWPALPTKSISILAKTSCGAFCLCWTDIARRTPETGISATILFSGAVSQGTLGPQPADSYRRLRERLLGPPWRDRGRATMEPMSQPTPHALWF